MKTLHPNKTSNDFNLNKYLKNRKRNWQNTFIILFTLPIYMFLLEKGKYYINSIYKWIGYQSDSDNYVFTALFCVFYLFSILSICFWNEMRRNSNELFKKRNLNKVFTNEEYLKRG